MRQPKEEISPKQRALVAVSLVALITVCAFQLLGIAREQIFGYWRTRSETTVEAQVRSVETRYVSSGKAGGHRIVLAVYEYEAGGRRFAGSRISLFKPDMQFYPMLSSAVDSKQPVRVFIDPMHPEFAVMNRDFTWWPLVLNIAFLLALMALFVVALRGLLRG